MSDDNLYGQKAPPKSLGETPIEKGDFNKLPKHVQRFVVLSVQQYGPRSVHICDGSKEEAEEIIGKLVERKTLSKLRKYRNNYLCRVDQENSARLQAQTFVCTPSKYDSVPHVKEGVQGVLGQWMNPEDMKRNMDDRFPGCMAGRMMYVIPFMLGPVGCPLSKIGVQLTDSNYVLLWMRIMNRVSLNVLKLLGNRRDFIKCVHSMGCPRPVQRHVTNPWPCNPERTLIALFPKERKIKCFGGGYGGSSILGRKSFSLSLASVVAREEGWMAEHMLIMSITTPHSREFFVAAAFPEHCGRTSLAMMISGLPGYKIKCVGKDVAWMRFSERGELMAVNPEAGISGRASGLSFKVNPNAMMTVQDNSLFTNVAETSAGGYYWEGMEKELLKSSGITDWQGHPWTSASPGPAAHPDSRFTSPSAQCPAMHPKWDSAEGVPISAIIFGGRYSTEVPLVYEAKSWAHGVMVGACVKSETVDNSTCEKKMTHDPMAMRSYLSYNFGHYLQHWLDMEKSPRKMPKIFHVNWFRENKQGQLLWPGFGDNIRVIDWILRRCDGDASIYTESPIGLLPKKDCINMTGLPDVDMDTLHSLQINDLLKETHDNLAWLGEQVGSATPTIIVKLLEDQGKALKRAASTVASDDGPCPFVTHNRSYVCLSRPRRGPTTCI